MPLHMQKYFLPKIPLLLVLWSKCDSFIKFHLLCDASFFIQGFFSPMPSSNLGAVDEPQNTHTAQLHVVCFST